jgi:sporulation-control protein spo0M
MKLFGKAATQSLTVTIDSEAKGSIGPNGNSVVRPGDPIHAVVHIIGGPDDKTRRAVARLVCTHHWASEVEDDDTSSRSTVEWHDDEVVAGERELVPGGAPVAESDYPVTFTLPADATPSSSEAIWWTVQAEIGRRMGKDVLGGAVFTVPAGKDIHVGVAGEPGISQHNPAFEIDTPVRTVQPGSTLSGTVVVKPTADVSYEKLVVDVQMARLDRRDTKITRRTSSHFSQVVLAEHLSIPAGAVREFPFSVQVPDGASPTTYGRHTVKNWWLVASGMTKRLHHNQVFQLELNVYNDPA